MKLKFLTALLLLLVVSGQPARSQEPAKPLSRNQVMELVKAGMDSAELADRVKQVGIDFDLTDDYLQALRKAGAQEVLIQALRTVRPTPLTRDQVLELVAGHVPSQRAAALVRQRGIDFLPDEEYLQTLRLAGAEEVLLAALRDAGALAMAGLLVVTSPSAEVFLDGESRGHADAQGDLAMKAKLGAHTLKVSLAGKKDFEQSITLAGVQLTKIEARLQVQGGPVRQNPRDGVKYVWIPPGTFMMGCSRGDTECGDDEEPAHQVTISRGFWMGQTDVTVAAFTEYSRLTGAHNPGWQKEGQFPVVNVDWDDASGYCRWAGLRLPTEAEWEYAARAGSSETRYGNLDDIAWYYGNSGNTWHEVAQKAPDSLGLYDMLGNVWQWVNDWYDQNYYRTSPSQDPPGPSGGKMRVLRGGSWNYGPQYVRVSYRYWLNPGLWFRDVGFRCAGEVLNP